MTPYRPSSARALRCAAAIALACAVSCSARSGPAGDLVVTSHAPAETSTRGEPLQIQFDQPVVEDAELGRALEAPPATISPAVALTGHWLDRQTLILTPTDELKRATRYRVALTGELGKRTGGFSFSFVHEPLVVEGIWGIDVAQLPIEPTLPLHFNQPVRVKDVLASCRLQAAGEQRAIALVAAEDARDGETIPVKPRQALEQDRDYELSCDKLRAVEGDAPLATAYVQALHTYAPLRVVSFAPEGDDVAADHVGVMLQLSTPVSLEMVRQSLRAHPAIPGLDQGWLDRAGTTYKATVNLDTTTTYELSLAEDLTDTFGQRLATPFAIAFTTGNARPRLSLETGIYALETQSDGYPVWTRNLPDFEVECATVPRERIVQILTSALDYDPWYDAGSDLALDWKSMGLRPRTTKIAAKDAQNNWSLTNLAMHEVCGAARRNGVYLANLGSRHLEEDPDEPWRYRPHRRVLANVTDLGILLKAGPSSGLVWVTRLSTGKPAPDASVAIYTPQGKVAFRGKTDASGILRIPGSTTLLKQSTSAQADDDEYDEYYSYRAQRMFAVVETGDDLAVVDGNWANGIQTWNFGVREERMSAGAARMRGFIQSDRGIYRPGETVHFKGLVREVALGRTPSVPGQGKIAIQVEDSRGQTLLSTRAELSRFGGFAFDLPLSSEANLGDYHVRATLDSQTFRERFSVEEFRPVSFELALTGNARHGRHGDKLGFELAANHLFGAPVTGAEVEWRVQRRDAYLSFPEFPGYGFGELAGRGWWYGDYDGYGSYLSYVSDGTGTTDRTGRFRFSVRDPGAGGSKPQDYLVGVSVKDETDQVVSKQTVITTHPSNFYLGLHTQEYVQAVDMPFAVNVVALTPEGKQVATPATLQFIRDTHSCEYQGGYRSYPVCTSKQEVALTRTFDVPATGAATERILPKEPGEYIVRIEARDSDGNQVVASGNIWVIGRGEAFWSGDESARMGLIASKKRYEPGETARLVPRTGLANATALVTLERDGVIDAHVISLERASDGVELALSDSHAPNVYASVALVTGRTGEGDRARPRFQMGITELEVSSDKQRLDVAIETEHDTYQPGETVAGVIRVTSRGQPVSAELSLSVADEGVLQLIAYRTPDPMKTFYASWGLGVDAATNLNRIARLSEPGAGDPDEGGDSDSDLDEDRVRSNFVASAFWAAALVTDERGEVRFSFTAPDNLTAFRAMAVAADDGARFGSGERRITVKKPLLAKPVLPRFLNKGDKAMVGVVVHNYTGEAGTATVTAEAKGVKLGKATQTVKLDRDGSARVSFAAEAGAGREATFELAVAMGAHRDALRLTIPVHRPVILDKTTVASGVAGADGAETVTVPVAWNPALVSSHSSMTMTVDRTGLSDLEPSLRYLIEYPYGCLEQTLSRFIPLAKAKDLAESLSMKELEGTRMSSFIRAGVAKVARHQHADGHYSLWPGGGTYPHLTVYATYGLLEARRAGVTVPPEVLERSVGAIKQWSAGQTITPGGESATMAMAAFVLAELGQADAGLNARLYDARQALPRYGLAFLARAMKRARAPQSSIDTLVAELGAGATIDGAWAIMRESSPALADYMSSDVRSTAMTLSALLEIDPRHPLIDRLVAGLKRSQGAGGTWQNTQDNLYALVALADYARLQADGSELVTIAVGGKQEVTRRLKGSKVLALRRPLENARAGDITIQTSGKVRYAVRVVAAREDSQAEPVDQGFAIRRAYLDPATGAPLAAFKAGQLVKVRVEVESPDHRRFVAVEDPLPAGFEAVNTELATSANTSGARVQQSWGWTHRELRDDRVLAFADRMRSGTMVLEYLARATLPGTFTAPPARAEEMYSPDVHGRSAAREVVIQK